MPIALEDSGFYEWHEPLNPVPALGIDSRRIEEAVAYYHRKPFRGWFGHRSFGFDQSDLDFLTRTPDTLFLWLWDIDLSNIDGLYSLSKLVHLGVNPKRPGIDFSCFPDLHTVVNHWIKQDTGVASSTIASYNLWHFKPRSKSFDGLEVPRGVVKLELTWANPTSLSGLPELNFLQRLEIHRCRNLSDLSDLPRVAPSLQHLSISTSKKVEPTAGVVDHPSLQSAYINDEVVVDRR